MIIGRASPVAITYRPNSNAMYPQKQGEYEIYKYTHKKYTISKHDFKTTLK